MNLKQIKRKFNKLQDKVLSKNDWESSISFCLNSIHFNKNVDLLKIKENEDVIYGVEKNKIKHIRYNYILNVIEFVKHAKYADINKAEELVLSYNDSGITYNFAYCIKQSNKEKLFIKLLELNNLYYIKRFLKEIDFDKDKFKDLLLFL